MIPLAIAIGIIEDKIANDLTGNKSTKEHLEELKEKFKRHSCKKYDVKIKLKNSVVSFVGETPRFVSVLQFGNITGVEETEHFIILYSDCNREYIDINNIERIDVRVVEE